MNADTLFEIAHEVTQLHARYAAAVDSNNWDAWVALFT